MSRKIKVAPARHCGNGLVLGIEGTEKPVIRFLAECRECTEFMWFNMTARDTGGRRLRFVWENAHYSLGSHKDLPNVRPVYRQDDGEWKRVGEVEIEERLEGPRLIFETPEGGNVIDAALCYPYGERELSATLKKLKRRPEQTVAGLTTKGRPIRRFRFAANEPARRGGTAKPPGVYMIARQHSGETPGSLAMDGVFRALGEGLGADVEWWLLPFVDLDGVEDGNYGKDALPIDFNRAWGRMPMRPELKGIQSDIRTFAAVTAPQLLLDLHAPGYGEDGIYTFLPREERPEKQRQAVLSWAEKLNTRLVEAFNRSQATYCRVPNYASRWDYNDTSGTWAWEYAKIMGACTEISYQSYGGERLDIEAYRMAGRSIALAVMDFLAAADAVK